jgi:tetratricopeptide (TPR) repeat protein
MDLALAVALYSHVTQIPVPVDISATAEVKRDGAICSVEGLKEKIRALRQERYFVGHILISKKQETDSDPGLDLIRTGSVKDALDIVFTSTIDPTLFTAEIDIDAEMIKIRSQYDRYLIDTCIRNTKRMTQYLESRKCPLPEKQILHALFTCYWRRGSCHCHKGNVKKADTYLKKAHSLYRKHSGIILPNEYLNSEINFAVTLKDIFRYKEAKALHLKVQEEIERIGSGLDYENGKNLSSLSQLYLAECNFEEAEKYQRNALKFIPEHEIHRNLNYLAQILFRSKRFRSAKTCLNRSRELIEQTGKNRQKNLNFFNWFLSEYLYRKGMSLKQRPQKIKNFKDLHLLASKYPDINGYVPALIHKFSALALLEQGIRQEGMDKLDLVIQYFNAQNSPIFRLLGVSASVEKALYLLKYNDLPDAAESLKDIRKNLKLQKDVHHYFSKELKELSRYLRFKNPGEDKIKAVCSALEALGRKIPY